MNMPQGIPQRPTGSPRAHPTTWHLIVERHETATGGGFWGTDLLGECFGTREQALAMLEERARTYVPEHPWNRRRTQLYRTVDGFMMITEGVRSRRRWTCRFLVAELLWDTEVPTP
ncbi:hypothetical protein [Streptomyces flavofungini]|uniref:hypothetical protein n=1 Tax=Streptomyces flavofungini TaxID=68200 RepID=UPI0025B1F0F4|nr:hypothetical protein [Streptomyces flavofungini]WJV50616.1 hypothetical protein QUY26_37025 [Streptomyces flavofungini]